MTNYFGREDDWVSSGADAAHNAWLDEMGHVNAGLANSPRWEPDRGLPGWLLDHARRAEGWDEANADTQQRIDTALAELQARAADPVDPAKAHQHVARQGKTVDRDEWFEAGYDPGCPPDWWGADYPAASDLSRDADGDTR